MNSHQKIKLPFDSVFSAEEVQKFRNETKGCNRVIQTI
jgi:hypothetical protein